MDGIVLRCLLFESPVRHHLVVVGQLAGVGVVGYRTFLGALVAYLRLRFVHPLREVALYVLLYYGDVVLQDQHLLHCPDFLLYLYPVNANGEVDTAGRQGQLLLMQLLLQSLGKYFLPFPGIQCHKPLIGLKVKLKIIHARLKLFKRQFIHTILYALLK